MLWIPSHLVAKQIPHPGASYLHRYAVISVGWSDLQGTPPSWDDCLARLRRYPLGQALFHLSQVSIALSSADDGKDLEIQAGILRDLFGKRSTELLQRLQTFWRQPTFKDAQRPPALFHEIQLLHAAKLALRYQSPGYSTDEPSLEPLGEALLMLNDLVFQGQGLDLRSAETTTIASAMFTATDDPVHGFARASEIYLRTRPTIVKKHGFDMPLALRRSLGVDPNALWAALCALWGYFEQLTPQAMKHPLSPDSLWAPFTPQEREAITSVVALTVPEMAQKLASFSTDDVRPFNVFEFATHPLLLLDGKAICLSVELLKRKLITGLHYLFVDKLKPEDKKTYFPARGDTFEEYVSETLTRCFPVAEGLATGAEFIPAHKFQRKTEGPICDGAIFYGDSIIFLEIKSGQFDLQARVGNRESIDKKFAEIIVEGAQQLSHTIAAFREGGITIPGVTQGKVTSIYPILILLEHLVMNPVTYERVISETRAQGIFGRPDTATLQILNVAELEIIEAGLEAAQFGFLELLRSKISSDEWRGASFKNYVIERHPGFVSSHRSRRLAAIFEARRSSAEELVRSRVEAASTVPSTGEATAPPQAEASAPPRAPPRAGPER